MELRAFMQRDVRKRSTQSFGVREGTLDKSMPDHRKTSVQRWQRGEDIIFCLLRGDHSTSDNIGKRVIDTSCSRLLIGQNTLDKWKQMLTRRWDLSTQRIQLAKTMTSRFGNGETLETRTLAILPVGIAGVKEALRVYVVPGGARLLL